MQNDPCFGCKALKAENDFLVAELARMKVLTIDLAERLRLRIQDDRTAWPGDRGVMLEVERMKSSTYRREFNCETR
jgi:hypothetical protein